MQKKSFEIKSPLEITIASLIQLVVIIITSLIFSAVASLILLSLDDPLSLTAFASILIILLSCSICSFTSAKFIEAPPVCSLISGLLISALLLLCSTFVQNDNSMSALSIAIFYVSIPAVSFLISILPGRMTQKNRKHRIKHRKLYK